MSFYKLLPSLLFAFVLIGFVSCGEEDPFIPEEEEEEMGLTCGSEIYGVDLFTDVSVSTHKYGNSVTVLGFPADLFMDVYEPVGDTSTSRPVIAWAFGGSFLGGDKGQMENFARAYAQKGFVCVAVDYRLLSIANGIPDSVAALDIAVKASHDIKAAVRHLRRDAATDNLFNIDPDNIFLGGLSAGGIAAMQAAAFTEEDLTEAAPFIVDIINNNGGVEGLSGDEENLSYSSAVAGVISLSGAIYNLDFIDAGDPPIISFHGNDDDVVPYNFGFANVLGIPLVSLNGSGVVHPHCESIGLKNELYTIEGGDHVFIYTEDEFQADRDVFEDNAAMFLADIICK
jgi:hypothetical protein